VTTPFTVQVGGQAIHAVLHPGRDPVTVFVHGFRSNSAGTKALALAAHAEHQGRAFVRFDMRGCGQSDGEFADFTLSGALADLEAVLAHLSPRPVVLAGSSLGGLLSLQAARTHDTGLRGLMLIAPALHFVERVMDRLSEEDNARWRADGRFTFEDPYGEGPYTLGYSFYTDAQASRRPPLPELQCPVVILHGERDELLPAADSIELARHLRAREVALEIIPGGDHRLTAAIPLMCAYLDRLWSAGVQ